MSKYLYLFGFLYVIQVAVNSHNYPTLATLLILVGGVYVVLFSIWSINDVSN